MIRPQDRIRAAQIEQSLVNCMANGHSLPGISDPTARSVLIAQIIESERRQKYVDHIRINGSDGTNANPHTTGFNPLYATVHHLNLGNFDEACWILYLATHFGKNGKTQWELCRNFYGRLGELPIWSWNEAISNQEALFNWIETNSNTLKSSGFGNHRKYESISSPTKGLRVVLSSYFEVFGGGHRAAFDLALGGANDPNVRFDLLYRLFSRIFRFGRLACFDHVAMVSRLGLEGSTPGSTYLKTATGPKRGAALLLYNNVERRPNIDDAERRLARLGIEIDVDPQVIEDSLCNWQKSPRVFIGFR